MLDKLFKIIALPFIISTILVGCASAPPANNPRSNNTVYIKPNECLHSQCGYEGAYESGESKFAEAEARRLNLASLERLKRISLDYN